VTTRLEPGRRVRLPGIDGWTTVTDAIETATGWRIYADTDDGGMVRRDLTAEQAGLLEVIAEDGSADSVSILAGLWAEWMRAATINASATALATTPLRPYAHQDNAVYGAMLPQPRLRFLLADEPGTGKTIMAGLYLREMQRLGLVNRALVVCPAHLVTKWQADFERFFGGGLKRITADTAKDGPLRPDQDLWITSLDLAAVNPMVQEVIRPDRAGWDVVVFDEAHRLTPTAQGYYQVGRMLCYGSPRVLLMTATPHRGSEWLFRSLMHLVDPAVFPPSDKDDDLTHHIKPGRIHFIRRMKEELVDYDGVTPLFKGRTASNIAVPLNATEAAFYQQALELVDSYFPANSAALARMVYGKRAASSLYALAETLRRRHDRMGTETPVAAAAAADPEDEDPPTRDEAKVTHEASKSAKAERIAIRQVLDQLEHLLAGGPQHVSKWPAIDNECLARNGILPGNGEQAVVFTEYADTADWLVGLFRSAGYTAQRYSGRDPHSIRDDTRTAFARHDFQILVSTDAGNEGIDLQSAHVLVNWDIPWSLVRLEQRMGRIHRLGQTCDVELYNLIATDTREGDVLQVLLDNLVAAANRLDGKLFDSLSLVAENLNLDMESLLARTYDERSLPQDAMKAARAMTVARLEAEAKKAAREEDFLRSTVDVASALAGLHKDALDRVNPHIVETFLARLSAADAVTAVPHASGNGIFLLRSAPDGLLPSELGGGKEAVVATSAAAVARAADEGSAVAGVVTLGPSEPAFRSLVLEAQQRLRPHLFQGGTLSDPTSSTGYDVACYEVEASEGLRRTVWQSLVRVDDTGARVIRWESLANLVQCDEPGRVLHPARAADADAAARDAADAERARRMSALADWLAGARYDLERLPSSLTSDIADPATRSAERRRLETAVADNLADLERMATVQVGEVHRVGWSHVTPAGPPPDPTKKDSEDISMRLVTRALRSDGWGVADVHLEDRGYDLLAIKGRNQRCVEVKGVWRSASASGVVLTGNEMLIAGQMGREYWLWVVDRCSEGVGKTFGVYADPAAEFAGLTKDEALVRVPGSALKAARQEAVPA
jgi:superfamily II DNA or RNA helicase